MYSGVSFESCFYSEDYITGGFGLYSKVNNSNNKKGKSNLKKQDLEEHVPFNTGFLQTRLTVCRKSFNVLVL